MRLNDSTFLLNQKTSRASLGSRIIDGNLHTTHNLNLRKR